MFFRFAQFLYEFSVNSGRYIKKLVLFPRQVLVGVIRVYQKTFSPDHGIFAGLSLYGCRYRPTCSEYTIQALTRFGVARGLVLAGWRIIRCNPWSHGGIDDVPKTFTLNPFKKHS